MSEDTVLPGAPNERELLERWIACCRQMGALQRQLHHLQKMLSQDKRTPILKRKARELGISKRPAYTLQKYLLPWLRHLKG